MGTGMIDHVSIAVQNLARSARFYELVLEPLGYTRQADHPARVAFGTKYPELWLNARPAMAPVTADTGAHICLRTRTTEAVDAFYARALANGGTDDGAPGLRAATQVVYYAAFIRDPDGNRLEVMTVPAPPQRKV
jgi:catechol 2,3-dioxygenase-like lactoylglutathione lyase family enzyme